MKTLRVAILVSLVFIVLPVATAGPAVGTVWQWQLTGTIDTSVNVPVYDVDLFDTPVDTLKSLKQRGVYLICYFSAGSWEEWRPDAAQFPAAVQGRSNGWPGERWLDIRSPAVKTIMAARLDLCKSKGFDAVEPDNVDGYTNETGFALAAEDQLAFNRWLAQAAHQRGLEVALKNDPEQVADLVNDFDFSIAEECVRYHECSSYSPFIAAGKAVLAVEYDEEFPTICGEVPAGFSLMIKQSSLNAWRQSCQ